MKRAIAFVTLALLSSCSSDTIESQHAKLADLGFDVPAGWQRVDRQHYGVRSSEWRPEDNVRKESLLIIRSETASLSPSVETIEKLLGEIPKGFSRSTFGKTSPLTTRSGLTGAQVEGDYAPSGADVRYHRIHVVLAEKSGAIIHVLYTARTPDPNRASLQLVIDSIRNEET